MGYVIRYGEDVPDSVPVKAGKYGSLVAVLLIIGTMTMGGFLMKEPIRETLLPWTRDSVQTAFADFSADMREGASFRDAFGGFCREILDEAKETS